MKLRANKLKPFRFDPTGIFDEKHDITERTLLQCAKSLEYLRTSFLDSLEQDRRPQSAAIGDRPDLVDPCLSNFYNLPRNLLLQYEADRRGSELARLFKMANRMHTSVDRVVLLGGEGTALGGQVLMDSCCQPYWNELSRGDRGSKPRLYFDGQIPDNDATQGLLHLMGATVGKKSTSETDAWGLILVEGIDPSSEDLLAIRTFLAALQWNCGDDAATVSERICAVMQFEGSSRGGVREVVDQLGCSDKFKLPQNLPKGFSIFSALGLIPAALLGINVIELLVGAAAMNDHFEKMPAEENIVLQHLAASQLLLDKKGISIQSTSVWNQSLKNVNAWQNLLLDSTGEYPFRCKRTATCLSEEASVSIPTNGVLYHNIVVDDYRFDKLCPPPPPVEANAMDQVELSIPETNRKRIQLKNQERNLAGCPTTNLFLPKIDELHMGGFLQMQMIVSAMETKMLSFA